MAGNVNFDNVVSTTIDNYQPKLADNLTNNNELLRDLQSRGNVRTEDGGVRILQNLEFSDSGTAIRYSGAQTWTLTSNKFATAAEYPRKQIAVPLVFVRSEKLANNGTKQMIDLIESRIGNGTKTLQNTLANDVYLNGAITNQIGGLQYLVSDAPTTGIVGGIDRSNASDSWWRNQVISGTTLTKDTIGDAMLELFTKTKRNNDTIKAIYSDNILWTMYYDSLQAQQRFTSTDGKGGFVANTLAFMGNIPVKLDGGIGGSCPPGHMYGLNTDYIFLRPNAQTNGIRRGKVDSINQDAYVDAWLWAGQMTMSGGQFQGVIVQS